MTEPIENPDAPPVEPVVETPLQQEPPEPVPTPPVEPVAPIAGSSEYEVQAKRLTGAFQTIEKLTIRNQELEANAAAQTSTIEQLELQLQTKDTESGIVVGERDKLLTSQSEKLVALRAENADLKGFKRKVDMIIELDRPELVKALNIVPNMENDEALRAAMTDVLSFRDDGALQRERELTSGVVDHTPVLDDVPDKPTTEEGWDKLIASFPTGTREHSKALADKGDWLFGGPQQG
jgi:hypothetical protein